MATCAPMSPACCGWPSAETAVWPAQKRVRRGLTEVRWRLIWGKDRGHRPGVRRHGKLGQFGTYGPDQSRPARHTFRMTLPRR